MPDSRFFVMVSESNNVSELNLMLITKIVSSSEINVSSEIETLTAIDNWISYDH